jgi:Uncharacterised methyltransferase family (DUF6094)
VRLAGQMKAGFFPCPTEAIEAMLTHLEKPTNPDRTTIIDPCAGKGVALIQIADGLGIPRKNVFAVELNTGRANLIRENYPDINLLGPCSFAGSRISAGSMSFVYLNPPFDHEFGGGGREETAFLRQAAFLMPPGGVLIFVLPANQVFDNNEICEVLDTWFQNLELYLFPDGVREYGECVVIGKRRKQPLPPSELKSSGVFYKRGIWSADFGDDLEEKLPRLGQVAYESWRYGDPVELSLRSKIDTWSPVLGEQPRRFEKIELTEDELNDGLSQSPLYQAFETKEARRLRRPPLSLNKGHTSLLLLSGLLDGYVPSDPPHVVRGYCGKQSRLQRVEHYETETSHVEKRVSADVPLPVVRAVWPDGKITTFGEPETTEEVEVEADPTEEGDDE